MEEMEQLEQWEENNQKSGYWSGLLSGLLLAVLLVSPRGTKRKETEILHLAKKAVFPNAHHPSSLRWPSLFCFMGNPASGLKMTSFHLSPPLEFKCSFTLNTELYDLDLTFSHYLCGF